MKGIELPINVLIIVSVAVIVLIALVAMFYPAFAGGSSTVSLEVAKSQACRAMIANGCVAWPADIPISNFDANMDGKSDTNGNTGGSCGPGASSGDNLWTLCRCRLLIEETFPGCAQCLRDVCGCTQTPPGCS